MADTDTKQTPRSLVMAPFARVTKARGNTTTEGGRGDYWGGRRRDERRGGKSIHRPFLNAQSLEFYLCAYYLVEGNKLGYCHV